MTSRSLGLDYLRGVVVLQVVVNHACLAYVRVGSIAQGAPMISDGDKSVAALPVAIVSDAYYMSLMFFISGLFVAPSLVRRGAWGFVRARAWRLGPPFVLGLLLVMPPSYYAWYRSIGGKLDLLTFWASFFSQPVWLVGPLWFLLLLFLLDALAACLHRLVPGFVERLGRWTSRAALYPLRFCLALIGCAFTAYLPLLLIFGPGWVAVGPVAVQASRLMLYGMFFFVGVGIGAWGIPRGLLGPESPLVRRWPRWVLGAAATQLLYVAVLFMVVPALLRVSLVLTALVFSVVYVCACAASGLASLAAFQSLARRNAILDSISTNSLGIFVVHFFFVLWAQYLLLDWKLPGIFKAALVIISALALSWSLAAFLGRVGGIFERGFAAARRVPGA